LSGLPGSAAHGSTLRLARQQGREAIRWTPESFQNAAANAGPSSDGTPIVTALQEQLGLKLESQRGPVEFLNIDRIERPASD